jgi:hypothetical protein
MIFVKYFTASSLFLILLTSCSSEPESNPILSVYKGTIKGVVYDTKTNSPIYYARISTNPKTIETYTGADGDFILKDIMAGHYVVTAYREGYDDDTVSVTLKDKDTINTTFSLQDFSIYLDYYPLEIGNYWEYWVNTPSHSIEIISDTLIGNLNYYVSIFKSLPSGTYTETRFERIDTFNALVYRYFPLEENEMIIDSLPAKQGQRFTSNMFLEWGVCTSYCSNIEERNIFGEIRKLRYLYHDCGQDLPWYQILKGIGLYSFGNPHGGETLKYAIIRGVEYGGN